MRITLVTLAVGLITLVLLPAAAEEETPSKAVERMVAELRPYVSRVRGLPWKRDVGVRIIARADVPAVLRKYMDENMPAELQETARLVLHRLGLLAPDKDPVEILIEALRDLGQGYYDSKSGDLLILGDWSGEAQMPLIAHELNHALEDQHFDLESMLLPVARDSDRSFAVECLVEGSAEIMRNRYMADHPKVAQMLQKALMTPETTERQMRALTEVPAILIVDTLLHYRVGPRLVGKWLEKNPKASLDELFQNPPVSQEQWLRPNRWFTETPDYPRAVVWAGDLAAVAGKGWSVAADETLGELDLGLYLDHFLSENGGIIDPTDLMKAIPLSRRAALAAEGWDAGRLAFLRKEGAAVAVIQAWAFDTRGDAAEAAIALGEALELRNGKAWKSEGWKPAPPRMIHDATATITLNYEGKHGLGRMILRGRGEILIADGLSAEVLARLWPWILRTRFMKDDRDLWDCP
jgi:hypothetical protein